MKIPEGPVAIGALIAFSAWLFVGLPIYLGPLERVQYYENAKAAPQSTAAEPKGTAQAPYFVQVVPSPKTAAERTQETQDRDEKRLADKWLVRWTAALFAATVGLILATGVLAYFAYRQSQDMRASIAAAKKAADAADKSARAMIGLELPVIQIKPDKIISTSERLGADKLVVSYGVERVVFANFGRTRAIPKEIRYGMTYGDALPVFPVYAGSDIFLPGNSFEPPPPAPGLHVTPQKRLSNCSVVIPDDAVDKLRTNEAGLWLYCCLDYEDFMGEQRKIGRCWAWITNAGSTVGWRQSDVSGYHYNS